MYKVNLLLPVCSEEKDVKLQAQSHPTGILYWCLTSVLKPKHQAVHQINRRAFPQVSPYPTSFFQLSTNLAHCPSHQTLHLSPFRVEKACDDLPPKGKPRLWDWESFRSQSKCFWTPEGAAKTFGLLIAQWLLIRALGMNNSPAI